MVLDSCIFCRIVKGKTPAYVVFEDEKTIAFLDTVPLSRGHTLVIPKTHCVKLEDLDWVDAKALFKTVYILLNTIPNAVESPACTVAVNNGPESGQEIPHAHVHIIPRYRNDRGGPIHAIMRQRPRFSNNELIQIAQRIRDLSSLH
ncbi:MAG: HIT domain-containing protein [Candidatus Bathyarchaeota archaeon]|nr:MAG: HIT domain-containing protein [Candidatus Bathyarchaeota archaeon]